jgi:uncharacterized protein (TIGR02646 family)
MLHIKKDKPPDFFNSWIQNKKEYNQRLREYILEHEQRRVCCYCEKGVKAHPDDSHVEHVRPQDRFPKLKDDYRNLLVSCQTAGRCGNGKGNRFSAHFIVPTEEDSADYLTYSPNGEIRPLGNKKKAAETIGILNLNAYSLVKARRTLFVQLNEMKGSEDFEEILDYFSEYPTFISYFKENHR